MYLIGLMLHGVRTTEYDFASVQLLSQSVK